MQKEVIQEIYDNLNEVNPVDYDCGKLCGQLCCIYDEDDYANEDLVIYLLPGEESVIKEDENFKIESVEARKLNYPFSWDRVHILKCLNPPHCNRKSRPIQCRTFPLIPHITKNNEFHLVFDESEYPYRCPLIEQDIELNEDFINETYRSWKKLMENPLVHDLVSMDSRKKENRKINYKIII